MFRTPCTFHFPPKNLTVAWHREAMGGVLTPFPPDSFHPESEEICKILSKSKQKYISCPFINGELCFGSHSLRLSHLAHWSSEDFNFTPTITAGLGIWERGWEFNSPLCLLDRGWTSWSIGSLPFCNSKIIIYHYKTKVTDDSSFGDDGDCESTWNFSLCFTRVI